jgi:RNA polymerase II C-terminal domain phosphatase-like 3/4
MKIISEKGFPQDSPDMGSSSTSSMGVPDDTCAHPTFLKGNCLVCETKLGKRYGLAFTYIDKDLWLSHDEIARIRKVESEKLLKQRKMVLVLDLDHTLLHTTSEEKYQKTQEELNSQHNSNDGLLISLESWLRMTKLRPYVHKFLKEASTMFEMYIYTKGDRRYALRMAELLDPENVYFNSRIIAYEDLLKKDEKSLDLVLKHERMVLVLDDSNTVWRNHQHNLIPVKRYVYFDSRDKSVVSLSALNTDEDETTGELATILEKLQLIYSLFFHPKFKGDLAHRDVRLILARLGVLQGCKIIFNRRFPTKFKPENSRLWMMAEELGAICCTSIVANITHEVSLVATAKEYHQAELDKKLMVHPRWLHACYDELERKAEQDFRPIEPMEIISEFTCINSTRSSTISIFFFFFFVICSLQLVNSRFFLEK